MKTRTILSFTAAALAMTLATAASAAPNCTNEPQSHWLSQTDMKARIAKMGYQKVKVFQVSGTCYEIYAYTRDGRRAEVYFNPVTGTIVENNED